MYAHVPPSPVVVDVSSGSSVMLIEDTRPEGSCVATPALVVTIDKSVDLDASFVSQEDSKLQAIQQNLPEVSYEKFHIPECETVDHSLISDVSKSPVLGSFELRSQHSFCAEPIELDNAIDDVPFRITTKTDSSKQPSEVDYGADSQIPSKVLSTSPTTERKRIRRRRRKRRDTEPGSLGRCADLAPPHKVSVS